MYLAALNLLLNAFGNLSVFFLSTEEKKIDNYLCFSEALKKDLVSINEVNERGSIRYLKLSNKSNQKILVLIFKGFFL